jgi:NTE family protein
VDMLVLEPSGLPFTMTGFLDFSPKAARAGIEYGRSTALTALEKWPAADKLRAAARADVTAGRQT